MLAARHAVAIATAVLFACGLIVLITRPGDQSAPSATPTLPASSTTTVAVTTTTLPPTTTTVAPPTTTAPSTTVPLPRAARVVTLPIIYLGPLPPPGVPNPYPSPFPTTSTSTTTTRPYPTTTRPFPTTTRPYPTTTRPYPTTTRPTTTTTRPSTPTTRRLFPVRAMPAPGAAIEVVPRAVGLPYDSTGCADEVCIILASQGGSGPFIINWEATSTTQNRCARFQYQSAGIVVAESPSKCSGSGIYTTRLVPNKTYPASTYLCATDTEAADTACNYVY